MCIQYSFLYGQDQVCFVKNKQVALMADWIYFPKAFQSCQKTAFSHTQQVAFSINGLHSPDSSITTLCIQYFVYICQSVLKSIITFTDWHLKSNCFKIWKDVNLGFCVDSVKKCHTNVFLLHKTSFSLWSKPWPPDLWTLREPLFYLRFSDKSCWNAEGLAVWLNGGIKFTIPVAVCFSEGFEGFRQQSRINTEGTVLCLVKH